MTDSEPNGGRPSWRPQCVPVRPEDVPIERAAAAVPEGGVCQRLLGRETHLQHIVATLTVRRVAAEQGTVLIARMHQSGILHLVHRSSAGDTRGFVVAAASSMEPRPIWPMLLPNSVLELAPLDWVIGCSVPKMPALEAIPDGAADAYVLGWLNGEDLKRLPIVTLQPHLGHEFQAQYRQAKNHWLRPIDQFPGQAAEAAADVQALGPRQRPGSCR